MSTRLSSLSPFISDAQACFFWAFSLPCHPNNKQFFLATLDNLIRLTDRYPQCQKQGSITMSTPLIPYLATKNKTPTACVLRVRKGSVQQIRSKQETKESSAPAVLKRKKKRKRQSVRYRLNHGSHAANVKKKRRSIKNERPLTTGG